MKKQLLYILTITSAFVMNAQVTLLKDVNTSGDGNPTRIFFDSTGKLYFQGNNGNGNSDALLYNGSNVINFDTRLSGSDTPNNFIELGGDVYFRAYFNDGVNNNGYELARYNGSSVNFITSFAGTTAGLPTQDDFVVLNNKLYIQIHDGSSTQIWEYDPSIATSSTNPRKIPFSTNTGYATPNSLSTGVLNGNTLIIGKITTGVGTSSVRLFTLDPITNTYTVIENLGGSSQLIAGISKGGKNYLSASDGKFYFEGDAPNGDDELWVTNGTTAGTMQISTINPTGDSDPSNLTEYNGNIYFKANDGTETGLYVYNGTISNRIGTVKDVQDIFSDGTLLYFTGSDGVNGVELWKYDGTTASMVKDINANASSSSPSNFIKLDGKVFFVAEDGTGRKLWYTNGTEAGTQSVFVNVGSTGENPTGINELVSNNNILYMNGTGSAGNELYMLAPSTLSTTTNQPEIISVFPNPTSDYIMVSKSLINKPYAIFEASGKLVKQGTIASEKINLNLSSGLYLIKITSENNTITKKIMVK